MTEIKIQRVAVTGARGFLGRHLLDRLHREPSYEAVVIGREEMAAAQDLGDYFRIPPDLRDLNYGKFVEQGEATISHSEDYHSHNTVRLDLEGMKKLLLKLDVVTSEAAGKVSGAESVDYPSL